LPENNQTDNNKTEKCW